MNEYKIEDISIGMKEEFQVTVTEEMLEMFCKLTGDCNPLHQNTGFAKICGYPDRVVYGMLTGSFLSTLAGMYLPGKYSLIQGVEVKFLKPVFPGDTLMIAGYVDEVHENFRMMKLKVLIMNQKEEKVLKGKMQIGWLSEACDFNKGGKLC